jgi:beta-galactosidase
LNTYNRFIIALFFCSITLCEAQVTFFENGERSRLAQEDGIFSGSSTRHVIDLSGTWEYSLDDKQMWRSVKIPSAFDGTGKVWFRRSFNVTSEMLDNFSSELFCAGVNYFCEIFVNENFVGRHIGGTTSFSFILEKHILQLGENNTISVYVDNELNARNTVPLRQQVGGWKNYGGIFRDIFLLFTPKFSFEKVTARSKIALSKASATITVRSLVRNQGFTNAHLQEGNKKYSPLLVVEVYDKATNFFIVKSTSFISLPEENHIAEYTTTLGIDFPQLWTPETPFLYEVRCNILFPPLEMPMLIDEYKFNYGIRVVSTKESNIFLNDSLYRLQGIVWLEDHPQFGSALTYAAMEKDITMMKNAGINLVRIANRTPHPYFLSLCDKFGLLVLEELPIARVPFEIFENDDFRRTGEAIAKEMADRDINHPSVLAYGIGDDIEFHSSAACDIIHTLKNALRGTDERLTYFATSTINSNTCEEEMDFIVLNISKWNHQETKNVLKSRLVQSKKPIVFVCYGRDVEPGNRRGSSDPHSYEAQARIFQTFFEGTKEIHPAGIALWSFNDWRGDRPSLSVHSGDPYLFTHGIVSEFREKRTAYEHLRVLYLGEKVSALPVGNYSFTAPMTYVIAGLGLLIVFTFFYNRNRHFRDNVNRSLFRTYNFFADVRDQRIISFGQTIIVTIVLAMTMAVMLSSILFHYRDSLFVDVLLSHLLVSDVIKENVVRIVWNPPSAIFWFTLLFIVAYLFLGAIVKFFSLFRRSKVFFLHAYEITVWSLLPFIIFIPIGMVMYRILETPLYVFPVFLLLILTKIWIVQRILKGVAVVYDIFPLRVYIVGIILIALVFAATYSYYDYTQSTSAYLRYMLSLTQSGN